MTGVQTCALPIYVFKERPIYTSTNPSRRATPIQNPKRISPNSQLEFGEEVYATSSGQSQMYGEIFNAGVFISQPLY